MVAKNGVFFKLFGGPPGSPRLTTKPLHLVQDTLLDRVEQVWGTPDPWLAPQMANFVPDREKRPFRMDVGDGLRFWGLKMGKNGRKWFFGPWMANTSPFMTPWWEKGPHIFGLPPHFGAWPTSPFSQGPKRAFLGLFGLFLGLF